MKVFSPSEFLILMVDDVSQNLQVLGSVLNRAGYGTTSAVNGQKALEQVESTMPDLILLDLMMPDMNGLDVCEMLHSHPHTKDIPIIMLTASSESRHLVSAFQSGAVDYITKPYRVPELLARVKTHLQLKKYREQLQKALSEMEQLVITDALTGIPNRRHLFEFAAKQLHQAKLYQRPLSLLMLDVDHFKKINDNYGHAVGDEVLKLVANNLTRTLRQEDCLSRFGGEEFVAILPDTDIEEAIVIGERVRLNLAESGILAQNQRFNITITVGISALKPNDQNIDDLLKRSDDAFLEAKRSGRNRCVVNHPSLEHRQASPIRPRFLGNNLIRA
jgi:diguanylate cyclase (GGDEF)-like protein